MSLRARVAALVVAAFTIALVVIGFVVPTVVHRYLVRQLDQQLDDARFVATRVALAEFEDATTTRRPPRGGPTATFAGAYVELRNADGTVRSARFIDPDASSGLSEPALPSTITDPPARPFGAESRNGDTSWRVLVIAAPATPDGVTGRTIVLALPTNAVDDTVGQVVRIQWYGGFAAVVALALAAWWLVGFGLRPLRTMERSAAAINDAGDLGERVDHPAAGTELGRLGATLNAMLGRLQSSFDAQRSTQEKLRRFVADASHELRTPLTSIRGYAELYRRGGHEPEQVARSMTRIEDEAVRMGKLVDDLLTLARLDESLPIERTSFDLASVLDDLVGDLRVVEPARSWTVDLPRPCVVDGDRNRLTQAFANLLANARVHTPPGSPVEVSAVTAETSVTVRIADHGGGLPPDTAAMAFDRFFRADPSRSRHQGGAGLGLAITAAIVEAHRGTIAVSTTPGGGATFSVQLPR